MTASIATRYEFGGSFNKDAQGWCCSRVEITQTADRVRVRSWFDENGATYDAREYEGTVGDEENGRVPIRRDDGKVEWFDLSTRQLVR